MIEINTIKMVDQAKSLGVIIDERLTWDEHFRLVKGSKTTEKYFSTIPALQCVLCSLRESSALWRRYLG